MTEEHRADMVMRKISWKEKNFSLFIKVHPEKEAKSILCLIWQNGEARGAQTSVLLSTSVPHMNRFNDFKPKWL